MIELTSYIEIPKFYRQKIAKFKKKIENKEFGFVELLNQNLKPILDFVKKNQEKFENILVLGIGGSALGEKALIQALKTPYWNFLDKKGRKGYPKIFFLDTTDPDQIFHLAKLLDLRKTLLIVISKSGKTAEPISLFLHFSKLCKKNIIIITGPNRNPLKEISEKENFQTFYIPENVSGRFSIFSPVGLLPAALVGINIKKIIEGAKKTKIKQAIELAEAQFFLDAKKNKNITVILPYSERLEKFADWYTQLLAESIGKKAKIGPTPLKATGPRDQHSLLQLFMDGPNNKFFIFIENKKFKHKIKIPAIYKNKQINYLHNKTFNLLISAQLQGTREALMKRDRPCITLTLNEINEEVIGQLFYLFELQVALLGEFYGVNAFNQPGVELGKKLTKKYLQ